MINLIIAAAQEQFGRGILLELGYNRSPTTGT
jgi:hypothetical protein